MIGRLHKEEDGCLQIMTLTNLKKLYDKTPAQLQNYIRVIGRIKNKENIENFYKNKECT